VLHAEHGLYRRDPGTGAWTERIPVDRSWKPEAIALLNGISERTPGSLVEEKNATVAWHYRDVPPERSRQALGEIRLVLAPLVGKRGFRLLEGKAVLEIRPPGVSKSLVASETGGKEASRVVAAGDDTTDEELFAALQGALCIHVGTGPTVADACVPSAEALRWLLETAAMFREPGLRPAGLSSQVRQS
jgi:trehalose 6-phosphate synthase/phosphatase